MRVNKIFLILILISSSTSCTLALSSKVWDKKTRYEEIESFFIDKENQRVVLIGEAGYALEKGTDHYSITDKTGKIFKVFETGLKSDSGIFVGLDGSDVSGSKVRSNRGWIGFGMNNLSQDDKDFLNSFNVSPGKKKYGDFGYYFARNGVANITIYPSSKEIFTNICSEANKDPNCSPIIKTIKPWKGPIKNVDTYPVLFGKLLLMPFTLVADILLTPVNAIIFVSEYHHDKPEKQKLSDK